MKLRLWQEITALELFTQAIACWWLMISVWIPGFSPLLWEYRALILKSLLAPKGWRRSSTACNKAGINPRTQLDWYRNLLEIQALVEAKLSHPSAQPVFLYITWVSLCSIRDRFLPQDPASEQHLFQLCLWDISCCSGELIRSLVSCFFLQL